MIVAIDGPAASGKGTLARRLARHFGYAYLDTGSLYRAVGFAVMQNGGDPADPDTAEAAARALDPGILNDERLRTDAVAQAASKVAAIPAVRAALLEFQRAFAKRPPDGARGAVLDGRDIGTVVCADADRKMFVTASVDVRAKRRFKELREKGHEVIESAVLQDMKDRDARDAGRTVAPLAPAEDALVLDTSDLDAEQVFTLAVKYVTEGRLG
ncbi:Cytidylate kinase [Caenispirillum salinarum AK4]|uniref:Cytidylate kinase n=1 Tax=Caenispirillum salinarum AK4 TaxID=1238182 RepID=K9H4E2_9PROT|nr:(d)CMP kinase [Caenispirillum salinarum]EKV32442.1 Cytidylate kinase [Caenispirillum salinarum AK4]